MLSSLLLSFALAPVAPLCATPLVQDAGDLAQGRALLDAGDAGAAVERLTDALDGLAPDEARELRLLLAEAQVAAGQADQAVVTLDGFDARQDHDVALALGRAYAAWAGNLEVAGAPPKDVELTLLDAKRSYERAFALAPEGSADAARELGSLELWRFGGTTRALGIAESGLESTPGDAELLLLLGNCRLMQFWDASQSEDEAAAGSLFDQAVAAMRAADAALPRERVDAQQQLQWLHEVRGLPNEAVAASIAVVTRAPDASFDELYRLARRYASERRFDASGAALEAMVRLSARDVTRRLAAEEQLDAVALELSWSIDPFYASGDRATARTILAAIVAAEPASRDVWYNYSVLCQETGSYDDAERALQTLIEMDPADPRPYNDLATLLKFDLERDFSRATELYDRCIALADAQLADDGLDPARRDEISTARQLAASNRDNDTGSPVRGLLDRLREGLRNVNLPGGDEGGTDGDAEGA